MDICKDKQYQEGLQKYKELKYSAKGRGEQSCVGHSHLEEQCMEETISNINQGILIQVRSSNTVAISVIERNITLVLRHLDDGLGVSKGAVLYRIPPNSPTFAGTIPVFLAKSAVPVRCSKVPQRR